MLTRRSVSAASRLFGDAEAESIRCDARSQRRKMVVLCMQRRSEPLNGSQLGFSPLAQLGQISMGGEAPDLSEDLLSGSELGQRQAQTEQCGVSFVLTVRFPRERRQVIDSQP